MEMIKRYCDACGEETKEIDGTIVVESVFLSALPSQKIEYCPKCFWKALYLLGFSRNSGLYLSHARREGLSDGGTLMTDKPDEPKAAAMLEYYETIQGKLRITCS